MVALPVLVSGLEAEMIRLGYKDSTMVWYRGAWRRLQRYFTARGVEEFSLDVAMEWVDEACGFFAKEQAGTLRQTDVYLFRVAQMLGEYETHGAVLRRYSRTVSRLSADEAAVVARFGAWLRAAERSASTVRSYGTLAGEFTAFAGTRGGLARCDAGTIGAFTATLAGYQAKTVEQKLCGLRSFLRFASEAGLAAAAAEAVPAVPSRRQARIPSVWDLGDVARILDAVDRGNPLLAATLFAHESAGFDVHVPAGLGGDVLGWAGPGRGWGAGVLAGARPPGRALRGSGSGRAVAGVTGLR